MKKTLLFLLIATLVLSTVALVACGEAPSISFVAPTKLNYMVGETLDLEGGKLVTYNADGTTAEQALKQDMLDATTVPDMATAGAFIITGSVENFEFSFQITVHAYPQSVSFVTPTKVSYKAGETFDLTGGSITIGETKYDLTMDMLDPTTIPTMSTEGEYVVNGSKDGVNFTFNVVIIDTIQVKVDDGFVYQRTQSIGSVLKCRTFNADGVTLTDWYDVLPEDISGYVVENGNLVINMAFLLNNKIINKSIAVPMNDTYMSVSQLKAQPTGTKALVNGVIVSFAAVMGRDEFVVADKTTGELISIGGMEGAGNLYEYNVDTHGFEVGDEIIVPVELKSSTVAGSDTGKLYAAYKGGELYQTGVVSKANTVVVDKANAVEITSQDQLLAFLSETNIASNHYKVVKLRGQLNFILYAASEHFRFWFENGVIDSYEEQCTAGTMSPCFNNGTQFYTTGAKFDEMVLTSNKGSLNDWSNPATEVVEIYAIFVGGNTYYHEFVILSVDDVTHLSVTKTGETFTAPTVVSYPINGTLNLTGAYITRKYDLRSDEVIAVTAEMLDASTMPDFTTAGIYTVQGSYEGFNFSFQVEVKDISIKAIAIGTMPTKVTYGHREGLSNLDLTGGTIVVTYTDNTTETIDMDQSMLPTEESADWQIGQVAYTLTYAGCTTDLVVTFENRAMSVSQLKAQTEYDKTYEVHGIIVGAQSSAAAHEVIIKDVNNNECIGVYNSGVVNSASNPTFKDDSNVKRGDEVIIKITLKKQTNLLTDTNGVNVNYGKVYATGSISTTAMILSHDNAFNWDTTQMTTTITTTQQMFDFLLGENPFYQWVKIVTPMTINYNSNYLRLFMDNTVTSLNTQQVSIRDELTSPVFHYASANSNLTNDFASYFNNITNTSYTNPGTTTYEFYALFVGGNAYYQIFALLDDALIVNTVS